MPPQAWITNNKESSEILFSNYSLASYLVRECLQIESDALFLLFPGQ
jgi:hypothetical protein